jgi:sortase A
MRRGRTLRLLANALVLGGALRVARDRKHRDEGSGPEPSFLADASVTDASPEVTPRVEASWADTYLADASQGPSSPADASGAGDSWADSFLVDASPVAVEPVPDRPGAAASPRPVEPVPDRVAPAPKRRRRALRALATTLVVAGVLALADAALTVAWMEPVTALQTKLSQDGLEGDLRRLEASGPTTADQRALRRAGLAPDRRDGRRRASGKARRRVALLARALRRRTADGAAVGRLRVPRLDLTSVLVKGSSPLPLRKGPGTFDDVPWPGERGTAAIAGHRTTYGAPFRDIDALRKGDAVTVEMPYATVRYRVEGHRIVEPDALEVLRKVGHDRIVLSACHPRFSASQRIVVFARVVEVVPARTRS